jgi:hypothetical protein
LVLLFTPTAANLVRVRGERRADARRALDRGE